VTNPDAERPDLLRAILRDPSAGLPSPSPEAHANALLRAHVLGVVSAALAARNESALLIKGAALALTVYPSPASRPMRDIDLLVPTRRMDAVVRALEAAGLESHQDRLRPKSRHLLGETQLVARAGAMSLLVEVHDRLDKVVPRPLDLAAIERRARPVDEDKLPALLVPSAEDHALLIADHAAAHEFRHAIGLVDLELLLRRGLDLGALEARARDARLVTVMFVALSTLRALGSPSVPRELVARFDPGPLRRAALRPFYDVGGFPVARLGASLGPRWILGQTPLRDDLAAFALGLVRYAAARVEDRRTREVG
jgi:hypothetical protein